MSRPQTLRPLCKATYIMPGCYNNLWFGFQTKILTRTNPAYELVQTRTNSAYTCSACSGAQSSHGRACWCKSFWILSSNKGHMANDADAQGQDIFCILCPKNASTRPSSCALIGQWNADQVNRCWTHQIWNTVLIRRLLRAQHGQLYQEGKYSFLRLWPKPFDLSFSRIFSSFSWTNVA